jgi:hypothetical protein
MLAMQYMFGPWGILAGQQSVHDAKKKQTPEITWDLARDIQPENRFVVHSFFDILSYEMLLGNLYVSHHQEDHTSFHLMVEIIPRKCFIISSSSAAFCILGSLWKRRNFTRIT